MAGLFPGRATTWTPTPGTAWSTARSVFAHDVHPAEAELTLLAEHGASVAHCPTSNPPWAADCSRCAGTSSTEFMSRSAPTWARAPTCPAQGGAAGLLHPAAARPRGLPLTPAHLLYLATRAGAQALGLDRVGGLTVGKDSTRFWLRPTAGALAVDLRHARDTTDALARIFALATPADVAGVWIRRTARRSARTRLPLAGAERQPAAVAGDVLVDAEVVLGVPRRGEQQLAVLQFDDPELELRKIR